MATPNTLTSRYLAEVAERGDRAARLVQLAREQFNLAATSYDGDCLTRPVFLEHAEFAVLRDDLLALHAALASLPGFPEQTGAILPRAPSMPPQMEERLPRKW